MNVSPATSERLNQATRYFVTGTVALHIVCVLRLPGLQNRWCIILVTRYKRCTDASCLHSACLCRTPQFLHLSNFCWEISFIFLLHAWQVIKMLSLLINLKFSTFLLVSLDFRVTQGHSEFPTVDWRITRIFCILPCWLKHGWHFEVGCIGGYWKK